MPKANQSIIFTTSTFVKHLILIVEVCIIYIMIDGGNRKRFEFPVSI